MPDSDARPRNTADADVAPTPVTAPFPCFDGLRAIAALSVFTYHLYLAYHPVPSGSLVDAEARRVIIQLGSFGVSIFFLISGFLLYRPSVVSHLTSRPAPGVAGFWTRRFFRIFPAYWVALTVAAFGFGFFRVRGWSGFVTYYGLVQSYRAGDVWRGLIVTWTLVIEVSFYLFLPFFAMAIRALKPDGSAKAKLRTQLFGVATLYVVAMGVRVWRLWYLQAPVAHPGSLFPIGQIGAWLISYLDWFALGMLLAVASAWKQTGHGLPHFVEWLGNHPGFCWLVSLGFYALIVTLRLGEPFHYIPAAPSFTAFLLFGVTALFMLVPAIFGPQNLVGVRAFLCTPVMVRVGVISYGIYLWHTIIIDEVRKWVLRGDFPSGLLVGAPVILAVTLGAATVSYHAVEKPLIKVSRRLSTGR